MLRLVDWAAGILGLDSRMVLMSWRVKEKCNNCPFSDSGQGLKLRKSLARGRWKEILENLKRDGFFQCHKTTRFGDEGEAVSGSSLLCAGALEWQEKHCGYVGQYA